MKGGFRYGFAGARPRPERCLVNPASIVPPEVLLIFPHITVNGQPRFPAVNHFKRLLHFHVAQ